MCTVGLGVSFTLCEPQWCGDRLVAVGDRVVPVVSRVPWAMWVQVLGDC